MNHSRRPANTFCTHRSVADDGRLLCDRIADTDREVTTALCQGCPASAAGCGSLRFTLHKETGPGIIVHYGNGRSLILDQAPTALRMRQAACCLTSQAISSAEECRVCSLHRAAVASGHPSMLPYQEVCVSQAVGS